MGFCWPHPLSNAWSMLIDCMSTVRIMLNCQSDTTKWSRTSRCALFCLLTYLLLISHTTEPSQAARPESQWGRWDPWQLLPPFRCLWTHTYAPLYEAWDILFVALGLWRFMASTGWSVWHCMGWGTWLGSSVLILCKWQVNLFTILYQCECWIIGPEYQMHQQTFLDPTMYSSLFVDKMCTTWRKTYCYRWNSFDIWSVIPCYSETSSMVNGVG